MAADPERKLRLRARAVSLFVAACLVGLVVWAPAAWLIAALPTPITCTETFGTVWHGGCVQARWVNSLGVPRQFGDVTWRWRASSFLKLSPEIRAEWHWQDARLVGSFQWQLADWTPGKWTPGSGWQIRDLSLDSDYRSLRSLVDRDLGPVWRVVPLEQRIYLDVARASGHAKEIDYLAATLRFFAYGQHSLVIEPNGRGRIQSEDGSLRLEGPLEWQRNGQFRLRIKISLAPTAENSLRQMMAMLGPSNTAGQHDLTIEGSLWTLLK